MRIFLPSFLLPEALSQALEICKNSLMESLRGCSYNLLHIQDAHVVLVLAGGGRQAAQEHAGVAGDCSCSFSLSNQDTQINLVS